jgi:predicted transglutaminase-like cysteine proteinase
MKYLIAILMLVVLPVGSQAAESKDNAEPASSAKHIAESRNVLAPLQFVKFCMNYPTDCEPGSADATLPTPEAAHRMLEQVNDRVNRSIEPTQKSTDPLIARWTIAPGAGDCNDYAVTKRHLLLAMGWATSALRLAVVFAPSGGHLVLIAQLQDGDYVLDNLSNVVKPWDQLDYQGVSMQSGVNPRFWVAIGRKPGPVDHDLSLISSAERH